MRTSKTQCFVGFVVVLAALPLSGSTVWAQENAGITGVARDSTGGILPGVAAVAASPQLITQTREAITDGTGRYNITALPPGTYTVTFTLPGFSVYVVEEVVLTTAFTATVNAEMTVGGLEETVTVTGVSEVVDIQNVRTQQTLDYEILEALPSGARDLTQFVSMTLGATNATQGRNDVGGDMGDANTSIAIHGGRGEDGKVNYAGMGTNGFWGDGGGQQRIFKFNTIGVKETVIDTGGAGASTETGGANLSMIPREGANQFSLHAIVAFANSSLAAGSVSDELIARGSQPQAKSMKKVYDNGLGLGGAIIQDRLWWYSATRFWGNQTFGANSFFNSSTDPFQFVPSTRRGFSSTYIRDTKGHFTIQATEKHKFSASTNWQRACNCWLFQGSGTASAPSADLSFQYGQGPGMWLTQGTWTFPASNNLLFQAGLSFLKQGTTFGNGIPPSVRVTERTTGISWGAPSGFHDLDFNRRSNNFTQRASMSYVTGSHQFETGIQGLMGAHTNGGGIRTIPASVAAFIGTNVRLNNGVPDQLTLHIAPSRSDTRIRTIGLFAQDQWTLDRLTLNLGLRYDHFWSFANPITLPASVRGFRPETTFPGRDDIPNYQDVSPRIGAAYDVFGDGRTAIKASWGRYVAGLGGSDSSALAPSGATINSTSRQWDDTNLNFLPDCVLSNFAANGECGAISNSQFGGSRALTGFAAARAKGWNIREYANRISVALQHELLTGLTMDVSYHRTDWNNQEATINNATPAADYTEGCITAPTDTRLGTVSGQQVCGLWDANPNVFGLVDSERVNAKDVNTSSSDPTELFNGVDIAINAQFGNGGIMLGGVSVGRTRFDYCWNNALPNITQERQPANLPRTAGFCEITGDLWDGVGSQVKFQVVYPLAYDFTVSGTFKALPGIPIPANFNASNASLAASLGRDLSACRGAVGAACTAVKSVGLAPSTAYSGNSAAVLHDQRINEVDLRLTKGLTIAGFRLQGVAELYNVFHNRPAQGILTTYGSSWLLPRAILGGRLFKVGVQVDY